MVPQLPQARRVTKHRARIAVIGLALSMSHCQCADTLTGVPPTGAVDGYVCDPGLETYAVEATVTGEGLYGDVTATTDSVGYFLLEDLKAGSQILRVVGKDDGFVDGIEVTVVADETTRLDNPGCKDPTTPGATGTINGRICVTEAGIAEDYWVVDARVFVEVSGDVYETRTDANGAFGLPGVPVGNRTVQVEKGSFSASYDVQVREDEVATIEDLCVAASVEIAVVTGIYDEIETVLTDMGFGVKDCMSTDPGFCPATLDPEGTVTLVDGSGPDYLTLLLDSWYDMQQFDVLFFSCGMATEFICSAPPGVIANLQDFVRSGGSIYVSDRAYEVLRVIFPGVMRFANETAFVPPASWPDTPGCNPVDQDGAWVGMQMMPGVQSTIVAAPLLEAVGSASVTLVYDKGGWVPLDVDQPDGVEPWMISDVLIDLDGDDIDDESLADAPVLATVLYGSGRIVYTTFHTSHQANEEMMAILRHIVFEL